MVGSRVLKTWSSTQPSVSLSSGEVGYYGVVKAMGATIGQQALLEYLGIKVGARVWTDSSAAIGVANRSGLGKIRHLATHTLWVQQHVKLGAVELRRVNAKVNPADLFTKFLESSERISFFQLFGCEYREGVRRQPHY